MGKLYLLIAALFLTSFSFKPLSDAELSFCETVKFVTNAIVTKTHNTSVKGAFVEKGQFESRISVKDWYRVYVEDDGEEFIFNAFSHEAPEDKTRAKYIELKALLISCMSLEDEPDYDDPDYYSVSIFPDKVTSVKLELMFIGKTEDFESFVSLSVSYFKE